MIQKALFGAGCFWGVEEYFRKINGVINTEVGYSGGHTKNPTYESVCYHNTDHAEVLQVEFDENIISYENIIRYFFEFHNPTTLNSQGPDFGTQYRSEIFYLSDKQKIIAEKIINEENKKLNGKVVTKLSLLKNYCPAEEYHQKYLDKNY